MGLSAIVLTAFTWLLLPSKAPQILTPPLQMIDGTQVRLLPGSVFYERQELHRKKFLRSWDPDRLLFDYRRLARLPQPDGVKGSYPGWDSGFIRGHMAGHYLSAASRMASETADPVFRKRVETMVEVLMNCQDALNEHGYLAAFPSVAFDHLEGTSPDSGGVVVPYYTIHKILSGLVDAHLYLRNMQALAVAEKLASYVDARIMRLSPLQVESIFRTDQNRNPQNEFGAMGDVLCRLYQATKNEKYLKLARFFCRPWFVDPLAAGEDRLAGMHANTHIAQSLGVASYANLSGDTAMKKASVNFWEMVTKDHTFVNGGTSFNEWFDKPGVEVGASIDGGKELPPTTEESCDTNNMLKLTARLFEREPKPEYADYFERALINHLLATVAPDTGAVTYFTPLDGNFRTYLTGTECCVGTGIENPPRYNEGVYFKRGRSLWINLYIPSKLDWSEQGLVLSESGDVASGAQTVSFAVERSSVAKDAVINFRIPYWISGPAILKVNGREMARTTAPSSYVALSRKWRKGDTIEISLPAGLRIERAKDRPSVASIFYGPVLLAGELGAANMPNDTAEKDRYLAVSNVSVPPIVSSMDVTEWLRPVNGGRLVFKAVDAGPVSGVVFRPLYDVHHQRYSVYWPLSSRPLIPPISAVAPNRERSRSNQ